MPLLQILTPEEEGSLRGVSTAFFTMNASTKPFPDLGAKWLPLVEQLAAGSAAGLEQLYTAIKSIKHYFIRSVGGEFADDAYHDLVLDLADAARRGAIRNPECFAAYAWTMARRKVIGHVRCVVRRRNENSGTAVVVDSAPNPEQAALQAEKREIAAHLLRVLPERDREILIRYYVNGETPAQVQGAMHLTETQFRLVKSRAKARFGELGRNRIAARPQPTVGRKPTSSCSRVCPGRARA